MKEQLVMKNKEIKEVGVLEKTRQTKSDILETFDIKPTEEEKVILIGNCMLLQDKSLMKESPVEYHRKSTETIKEMSDFFKKSGGEQVADVNMIYKKYNSGDPIIVRRENPVQTIKIVSGEKRDILFDGEVVDGRGDKYANCALWPYGPVNKTSGLANAFLEGQTSAGPIVTVIGFKNNPEHMTVEEPEGKMMEIGDISRHAAKILSGHIEKSDIEFIIMRIPAIFSDSFELSDLEQGLKNEGKLKQIFRGYDFSRK